MQSGESVKIDPAVARNRAREKFIAARTVEEQKLETWRQQVMKCHEEFRSKIPFDYEHISLRSEVPEWYAELPDKDTAHEQLLKLNEKLEAVNAMAREWNAKGLELLEQYNNM